VEYKVYLLRNSTGKIYIGISIDVALRLDQHNREISKWTKGKGPWTLIWTSEAKSLSDARKLENRLKRQKGGRGLYTMTGLPMSGS
jgi:putative endonuclease